MTQVLSHPLFAQLAPEWAGVSAWAAKLRASILEGGGPPPLLPRTFSHSNATSTLRAQFDPEAESGDDVLEAGPSVPTDPITLGTRPSFEQLVSEHEERIFNFILQFLRHRQDAEDLTQETFVKAYRSFDRYDPLLPFAPWLFTIARRTVASHFRSARQFEELTEERETGASDPAEQLASKDELGAVWRLARTLKPKQWEALWLRYGEGFCVAETARVMGVHPIHARVILHRARAALAELLVERGLVPAGLDLGTKGSL